MQYKPYPHELWENIKSTLLELKKTQKRLIAAFDADGTLWDIDLGENFFQYQIDNKLIPLPNDPWQHYLNLKKVNNDPRSAYVWLAQVNKGIELEQVKKWSQSAFDSIQPKPIFSEQKKLIDLFLEHAVEVYIVTASITWAVQPGAKAIGLDEKQVIGVETKVNSGLITELQLDPITYRQGKVEALLHKTGGVAPFFCSGNTIGDFELLKSATHLRLAVSAASRDDKLFKSENELQTIAAEHKWWKHRFI